MGVSNPAKHLPLCRSDTYIILLVLVVSTFVALFRLILWESSSRRLCVHEDIMAQRKDFHVAVCGGGIGGLCLTIGLLRQNVSCKLYEAASAFAEVGAGVSFGPNTIRAMELIDPQIAKGFENCSTTNGWPEKKDTWFDFRTGQEKGTLGGVLAAANTHVADVKTRGVGEIGQNSTHRAHFLNELVKLIPDEVPEFGKRLKNIDEKGDKMVLTFEDGTTAEADAVIGCDGIKSRTREILLGKDHEAAHAVFSGKYAYRGLIPMDIAVDALGDELAKNSQMYMGEHGHVLTFPIEKGKTMNVVAFRTKPDGKWEDEKWVLASKKEDMVMDFAGWGDKVTSIISVSWIPILTQKTMILQLIDMYSLWKSSTFGHCLNTHRHQHTTKAGYVFLEMRRMLRRPIKELAQVRLLKTPLFYHTYLVKSTLRLILPKLSWPTMLYEGHGANV